MATLFLARRSRRPDALSGAALLIARRGGADPTQAEFYLLAGSRGFWLTLDELVARIWNGLPTQIRDADGVLHPLALRSDGVDVRLVSRADNDAGAMVDALPQHT